MENSPSITKKEKKISNDPNNIEIIKPIIGENYSEPQPLLYFNDFNEDNNYIIKFNIFKSINNIIYLIYSNKQNSIIIFNLINNQQLNEIKKAHQDFITNFRNYIDEGNHKELLMSISEKSNNIKIWNIQNLELIHNFENINEIGSLYSACFLHNINNNQIYIVTSNNTNKCPNYIQIFNLKGEKLKDINDSDDNTFFIDTYYDNSLNKTFIITGNYCYVKSYDYDNNKLYFEYKDKSNCFSDHNNLIINKKDDIIRLIESSTAGYIRIWNFHNKNLLRKIKSDGGISSICLWNDRYIFVGCLSRRIRLLEIETQSFLKNINCLSAPYSNIIAIKKINHPKYGECLIYQEKNQIKYLLNKEC